MKDPLSLNDPIDGTERIQFVGGPWDGEFYLIPRDGRNRWHMPVKQSMMPATDSELMVGKVATYERAGRRDDGTPWFEYKGAW